MVNYRRNRAAGGTYFFTVNLEDCRSTLLVDHVSTLLRSIFNVKRHHPFVIEAMVIMPDHFHAVWTLPPGDSDYIRRLQLLKAQFTKHLLSAGILINRNRRGEYDLWQKRFWEHTIRDDFDFEAHVNYVHINPVKHGYVKRANDWPYSTIHQYVEKGVLAADWACGADEGEFGE